jgi:hypothetical protein
METEFMHANKTNETEESVSPPPCIRRKVFLSFYQGDKTEVEDLIDKFTVKDTIFIPRALGLFDIDDLIDSHNPEYVISQIRRKYLRDSTITIVFIGKCTHSRRYIDWEIKTSLRQSETYIPNGLIGIKLDSCKGAVILPPRFEENWNTTNQDCYARLWEVPIAVAQIQGYIEDAFLARTKRAPLINNSSDMMHYNGKCLSCGETH